ncbi:MAG: hypothetical protein Q4D24_05195 [Erysipelotrichaceae bacterium]|nr:hypothetical protein [Erysipelotrichaceae bacterium]
MKLKFVFIHGTAGWGSYDKRNEKMPYWGMRGGDLISYLNEKGFECYAASVSPFGSAWDRACELYAQIFGTKTDYGSANSETFRHERFGRDFTGYALIPEMNDDTKLVLIGHSFGGTTATMFAELMAHGDEAERDASKEDDISPLFMGGMEYRIHSIAAVACALNGNSSFDMLSDPDFDLSSVKVPWWSRYFGKRMYDQLQTETDGRDSRDCGDDDMQIDQALLLNERMSTLRMYIIIRSRAATRKRRVTDLYPKRAWSLSLLSVHSRSASIPARQKEVQRSVRNRMKMTEGSVPFLKHHLLEHRAENCFPVI